MRFSLLATAATVLALTGVAHAQSAAPQAPSACVRPTAPAMIDGATATMEQLIALKGQVGTFMEASDAYQTCVIAQVDAQRAAAKAAKTKVDPALAKTAKKALDDNQADKEKAGASFNAAVKAYKTAHPA